MELDQNNKTIKVSNRDENIDFIVIHPIDGAINYLTIEKENVDLLKEFLDIPTKDQSKLAFRLHEKSMACNKVINAVMKMIDKEDGDMYDLQNAINEYKNLNN